jgi:hypothetical protein
MVKRKVMVRAIIFPAARFPVEKTPISWDGMHQVAAQPNDPAL